VLEDVGGAIAWDPLATRHAVGVDHEGLEDLDLRMVHKESAVIGRYRQGQPR
jgi:hypothetical protein